MQPQLVHTFISNSVINLTSTFNLTGCQKAVTEFFCRHICGLLLNLVILVIITCILQLKSICFHLGQYFINPETHNFNFFFLNYRAKKHKQHNCTSSSAVKTNKIAKILRQNVIYKLQIACSSYSYCSKELKQLLR